MSCNVNDADTAFMMFASSLVCLQTPALALTQSGLVQRKNSLSILMQVFSGLVIGSLLFWLLGFTMIFGESVGGVIGDFRNPLLLGLDYRKCNPMAPRIPSVLFATWQMMFALMVPPIVTGAWAERLRFEAYLIFVPAFSVVYYFLAHWIWNTNGWLMVLGVRDFAGGLTIHLCTGAAALAAASTLARRRKRSHTEVSHHSLPVAFTGVAITFVGWYSFNGGSALSASPQAAVALLNTHLSACAGSLVWLVLARRRDGHWHLMDMTNGALAGLATITPGSGYVDLYAAVIFGLVGGACSYGAVSVVKDKLRIDDVLDVFALQGVPGLVGSLLVAVFASPAAQPEPAAALGFASGHYSAALRLLGVQLLGVLVTFCWSFGCTWLIFKLIRRFMHIDVGSDEEERGLDIVQMNEQAYDMTLDFISDMGDEWLAVKLCEAASHGDLNEVDKLLRAGANPDLGDYDGRRAVHVAASEGKRRVLQLLYTRARVNLEVKDRWKHTPIDEAVRARHINIVRWFRLHGCMVSRRFGERSLLVAAAANDAEMLELLFDGGASATWSDYDRRTALHVAIQNNCVEATEVILKNASPGFLVTAADRFGRVPMDYLKDDAPKQMQSLLTEWQRRRSAPANFKEPIQLGGDDSPRVFQASKQDKAKESERKRLQDLMNKEEREQRAVARDMCAAAAMSDIAELRRVLSKTKDRVALVNQSDYDGRTPLMLAAAEGQLECVQFLLDNGARPDLHDKYGHTALFEAVSHHHVEVANFIDDFSKTRRLPSGSARSINIDPDESTSLLLEYQGRGGGGGGQEPLETTYSPSVGTAATNIAHTLCEKASKGKLTEIRNLWKFGLVGNMDIADYDGRTPLHLAAAEGYFPLVEFLVDEAGVRPDPVDSFGFTPIDDARRHGHTGVIRFLEEAVAKQADNN